MKLRVVVLIAIALWMSGCQTQNPATTQPVTFTPARTLSLSTETITAAMNTVSTARDDGLLTQADIDPYEPVVDTAIALRNTAEKDLRAGNVSNVQSEINQIDAVLAQLQPLLSKVAAKQAAKKPATTQPSKG